MTRQAYIAPLRKRRLTGELYTRDHKTEALLSELWALPRDEVLARAQVSKRTDGSLPRSYPAGPTTGQVLQPSTPALGGLDLQRGSDDGWRDIRRKVQRGSTVRWSRPLIGEAGGERQRRVS
jgi:hypothetical protein